MLPHINWKIVNSGQLRHIFRSKLLLYITQINLSLLQLFGLALLIASSIYLKNLNKWAEHHSCVETIPENGDKFSTDILCSNYDAWRRSAIIGIIIVKSNRLNIYTRPIFSFQYFSFFDRVSSMCFSYHFFYAVAVASFAVVRRSFVHA